MTTTPFATDIRTLCLAAAFCLAAAPAFAQSGPWTERPYNPPIGSKWSVVSESSTDEQRAAGERRNQTVITRSELSFDEKLPDGFRVTYIRRENTITGNTSSVAIMQQALSGVKDITVRGRLDRSGKPIAVDNIKEVQATMRGIIDRTTAAIATKDAGVAGAIKQMMEGMLLVDGLDAAKTYMDDLPLLAIGQNTGLKPGEVRREDNEVSNPMVGPIKSVYTTSMKQWDDKTGIVRYLRREDVEPESMKAAIANFARRLMNASTSNSGITPELLEVMKQVSMTMGGEAVVSVEGGMTRLIGDYTNMAVSLGGQTLSRSDRRTLTVTPLN